jgi:uncharacterized damage-inducible protein DinB
MSIAQSFLPEFDHEIASTRRILERVPDDRLAWSPHPKSMTLGRLASHLSELPDLGATTFEHDALDFAPKTGQPAWTSKQLESRDAILANFDRAAARARAALASASDESLREPWTLRAGDHVIFQLPRIASYRSMMMNHLIHHRGQLSVYLRLCDVPVPGMYGPSNDER